MIKLPKIFFGNFLLLPIFVRPRSHSCFGISGSPRLT